MNYSFIIPVFNRPDEIRELLESFTKLKGNIPYEILIIEDGSDMPCDHVIEEFNNILKIIYLLKTNTGPGDSRNYGMDRANGNYFIILDSDCILPAQYLIIVDTHLKENYIDCYGGPDAAHSDFTHFQKSINFAMTSTLSTGGIRGGRKEVRNFQPRSFNMGISKEAYLATGGFGNIHPGEDPDLSLRLMKAGFKISLITEAYVYHKRRLSWSKFYKQVHNFGIVRPILNNWHPTSSKMIFCLPSLFLIGLIVAIILATFGIMLPIIIFAFYFCLVFITALFTEKSLSIAIYSILAVAIQILGYGFGFLESYIALNILNKKPEQHFSYLFFKNGQ